MAHVITRRSFMKAGAQAAAAAGLASLANIPGFLRQALADGTLGPTGNKKILFIFLRGGNDGINTILPIQDPGYAFFRPQIGIPKDPMTDYSMATGACDAPGVLQPYAIRAGNGFAALNPALYDLAPLFNTGQLALLHRVAYRSQSRSHFDSERYWEKGTDGVGANNRLVGDGIFYRAIVETGLHVNRALSGVSIQSNMPQSLRGRQPMTNLSSINRYNILGVSGTTSSTNGLTVAADRLKLLNGIDAANGRPYAEKDNRDLVHGLADAFRDTLDIFQNPDNDFASNPFVDEQGYPLFIINSTADNLLPVNRRLGSGAYGFFTNLKAAAQVLSLGGAVIAGTEMGGFDTHTNQNTTGSPHLGAHTNLLRRIGYAYYALWKFFNNPAYSPTVKWEDVVVVTLSEFGRTSVQNDSVGTDHAEASVMYVGGGGVNGGVYGCDGNPNPKLGGALNWVPCTAVVGPPASVLKDGSMFAANNSVGYLRRTIDYRSVLGEIIRDHLCASQDQLNRIIPAYANEGVERLKDGGAVSGTTIIGELGLV
jgi:uncharacterized protein (DUF1501 family)